MLEFPLLSYRENHVVSGDYMLCSHLGRASSPDRRVTYLTCENAVRLRTTGYIAETDAGGVGRSPIQE